MAAPPRHMVLTDMTIALAPACAVCTSKLPHLHSSCPRPTHRRGYLNEGFGELCRRLRGVDMCMQLPRCVCIPPRLCMHVFVCVCVHAYVCVSLCVGVCTYGWACRPACLLIACVRARAREWLHALLDGRAALSSLTAGSFIQTAREHA